MIIFLYTKYTQKLSHKNVSFYPVKNQIDYIWVLKKGWEHLIFLSSLNIVYFHFQIYNSSLYFKILMPQLNSSSVAFTLHSCSLERHEPISSPSSYQLNSGGGGLGSWALNSSRSRRKVSEFKTAEKITGNSSTIIHKNSLLVTDKEKESVVRHNCLYSEGIWHLKREKIIVIINNSNKILEVIIGESSKTHEKHKKYLQKI